MPKKVANNYNKILFTEKRVTLTKNAEIGMLKYVGSSNACPTNRAVLSASWSVFSYFNHSQSEDSKSSQKQINSNT